MVILEMWLRCDKPF